MYMVKSMSSLILKIQIQFYAAYNKNEQTKV